MHFPKGFYHGIRDKEGILYGQLPHLLQIFLQGDPVQVFHDQICRSVLHEEVLYLNDVLAALKLGSPSGLLQETFQPLLVFLAVASFIHDDLCLAGFSGHQSGGIKLLDGHRDPQFPVPGLIRDPETSEAYDHAYLIPVLKNGSGIQMICFLRWSSLHIPTVGTAKPYIFIARRYLIFFHAA